jgi:hypothetical protein
LTTSSVDDTSWDMFGMPRKTLVDNRPEFHGEALTRGCAEYGIELAHRAVARPGLVPTSSLLEPGKKRAERRRRQRYLTPVET